MADTRAADVAEHLFPQGASYLPSPFSAAAHRLFGAGLYDRVRDELRALPPDSYERAGVDRALAIAIDLAAAETPRGVSILDVGCSTALIGGLLHVCGYKVTGVDMMATPRSEPGMRVVRSDLRSFLEADTETYDVAVLLSVLHWFRGSGADLPDDLRTLCGRVRRILYVETPLSDEADEFKDLPCAAMFPQAFVDAGIACDIAWIASTVATNAKPRRLYRLKLK